MHLERRGKYPGVKIHLTKAECELLLTFLADFDRAKAHPDRLILNASARRGLYKHGKATARAIAEALADDPTILDARNEAEIRESMETELAKLTQKLAAFDAGEPWKADHD
jgi:hypothetical protein